MDEDKEAEQRMAEAELRAYREVQRRLEAYRTALARASASANSHQVASASAAGSPLAAAGAPGASGDAGASAGSAASSANSADLGHWQRQPPYPCPPYPAGPPGGGGRHSNINNTNVPPFSLADPRYGQPPPTHAQQAANQAQQYWAQHYKNYYRTARDEDLQPQIAAAENNYRRVAKTYDFYRRQPSPSSPPIPHHTARTVYTLADPRDADVLSEFWTFVRSECLEIFTTATATATSSSSSSSSSSSADVGGGISETTPVGIRCRFCAHHHRRSSSASAAVVAPRSQSFPSTTSRLYQSITMMIREHFSRCADVPPEVRERYDRLRRLGTTRRGSWSGSGTTGGGGGGLRSKLGGNAARYTRGFWVESAGRCGLYDDPGGEGIRYRRPADGQGIQLPTGGPGGFGAGGGGPGVGGGCTEATTGAAMAPAERGTVADSQGNAAASSSSRKSSRKKRKAGEELESTSVKPVPV